MWVMPDMTVAAGAIALNQRRRAHHPLPQQVRASLIRHLCRRTQSRSLLIEKAPQRWIDGLPFPRLHPVLPDSDRMMDTNYWGAGAACPKERWPCAAGLVVAQWVSHIHGSTGRANMKFVVMSVVLSLSTLAFAQEQKPMTLKAVLLEQLRSTHNKAEWFVPANTAVAGLTPAQASWTDKSGNHSVGQLANHLVFWDRESLAKFKGEKPAKFNGNNDETFNSFDAKSWNETVKQLDQVMTDWEQAVEAADDAKVSLWASTIAHIGAHNAYHIGQMVYVRKLQGVWDPDKGVK